MTAHPSSAGYQHRSHRHSPASFLLVLFILFLSSERKLFASTLFAPRTFKATPLAAYAQKGSSNPPEPLMRAWMCHGASQKEMVGKLASAGIVKAPINKAALLAVDRGNYVRNKEYAYEDSPSPIGYGQTISAPHMHAHVLEDLLPPLLKASKDQPDKPLSILDVGCGSGYLTAVFGRMVEPKASRKLPPSSASVLNEGKVYGIDVVPELVEMSKTNIMKEDGDLFDSNTVQVMVRDGWQGYPDGSPYNVIHVGAAAATFPQALLRQLAVGGVMVIPVGPDGGIQYLYQVDRIGDRGEVVGVSGDASKGFHEEDYQVQKMLGVRYVPLVQNRK